MTTSETQLDTLYQKILDDIGLPDEWPIWRGGWDRADLALLDAIYSVRQKYELTVRPKVLTWKSQFHVSLDSELEYLGQLDEKVIREVMGGNYLPGVRIPGTKVGKRKSVGVIEVAQRLSQQGLNSTNSIREAALEDRDRVIQLLRETKGIGIATSTYFLMLLGIDGVKVDTLLGDWVRNCLPGNDLSDIQVAELVACVAKDRFECSSTELDFAIWRNESARRKNRN